MFKAGQYFRKISFPDEKIAKRCGNFGQNSEGYLTLKQTKSRCEHFFNLTLICYETTQSVYQGKFYSFGNQVNGTATNAGRPGISSDDKNAKQRTQKKQLIHTHTTTYMLEKTVSKVAY